MPSASSVLDNSKFITTSTSNVLALGTNQRGSIESSVTPFSGSALRALQTEVAALNERIEILRREVEDREQAKRRAKRGARSLLKVRRFTCIDFFSGCDFDTLLSSLYALTIQLCFKHAAVNCALFLLLLAYLYRRRSPIAMKFLAHVAPAFFTSGRVMVDRFTEVAGKIQGKVTRN